MLKRLGLRGRAIALGVLLVLTTAVWIASALIWRGYALSLGSLTKHATQHARDMAYSAEPPLLLGDRQELQRMVKAASASGAVSAARINDRSGQTLARYCRDGHPPSSNCNCKFPTVAVHSLTTEPTVLKNDRHLLVAGTVFRSAEGLALNLEPADDVAPDIEEATPSDGQPPPSDPIGRILLAYDLSGLHDQVRAHVAFSVTIVALVIAASTGLMVIAVRQLLRPVWNLVDTTTQIAAGDLSRRASEEAVGEIGVLARSFNRMAGALSRNTESLEEQVRIRTAQLTRAAAALTEKQAYLRTLLESVPDCVKTLDEEGRILDMNPAGLSILGVDSVEEIRGTPVYRFIDPADRSAFESLHRRVLSGETGQLQFRLRLPSGDLAWVETHAAPLYNNASGSVTAHLAATRDVTEARRKVVELREAKERAEAGDKAKSEFLANISHEIRTPLNGILGMTQVALDAELSDNQRANLETILECAESLLYLINDILDFSKLGSGKVELEMTDLNVRACIESVAVLVSASARKKLVALEHRVGEDVPGDLVGDPHRLRQVLVNLISNAVKFTEEGSITISAVAECATATSVTLVLSVEDTGIGIPPDRLDVIFDSFRQADGSTTRTHGGTGLGLTICKQIVELMGGRMWVESTLGRGSTFYVRLELARVGAAVVNRPNQSAAAVQAPTAPILNLEDALARLCGDRQLLGEALASLLESLPEALDEIRRAIAAGDANALTTAAHGLQGAASTVGAEALAEAVARLAGLARMAGRPALEDALERVEDCTRRLRAEAKDPAPVWQVSA